MVKDMKKLVPFSNGIKKILAVKRRKCLKILLFIKQVKEFFKDVLSD
jgi:hypothetical protein